MFKLGINTGFAVNRYAEPEVWTRIIGLELGLKNIQLTADLLNPGYPSRILTSEIKKIRRCCLRYGTSVTSTFTGAFTRVNHLAHPEAAVRAYWVAWFKRFTDLTSDLGARCMGSHFGIFTLQDDNDPKAREERRRQNIEGWHEIALYAKGKGLDFLTWEPMSIRREQGETIASARKLQDDVNRGSSLPFKICLDLDHGDLQSPDPRDTDPYAWIAAFARESGQVHLKQTRNDHSGHKPFTREFNRTGNIRPGKILRTLSENGGGDLELILEPSFREREPDDSRVLAVLKESVAYWRRAVPD
jgi:sugar phosphate isomerase/epimerase